MVPGFRQAISYNRSNEVADQSRLMSKGHPFLILEQPCNEAIAWITRQASAVGLRVMRTFDWQGARKDLTDCHCPHYGTDRCDCQMVVLLLYADTYEPVSLVAHSYEGKTWFSLVNNPQQQVDPDLEAAIRQALSVESILPMDLANWSHEP